MTLRLRWPAPAAEWSAAAPVGNGRLGAMVFGDGRLQLNDSTVWSGTPSGPSHALRSVLASGAGPERSQQVRDAIDKRDYRLAESLLMSFEGPYSQEYLPFADLWMEIGGSPTYEGRVLDLDDALVEESFAGLRRRTFASRPAGALCVELIADAPVDVRLRLSSPLRVDVREGDPHTLVVGVAVPVDGAPQHEPDVEEPLRYLELGELVDGYDPFAAVAVAIDTDGRSSYHGGLVIEQATRLLVTISSSTSAADWWTSGAARSRPEHLEAARQQARSAAALGGEALLAAHLADVRPLLGTASVRIGPEPAEPVDVASLLEGDDAALMATVMVQLGRYLLVSASRPGGPPANLQGIWNDQLRPPWSSNYTININTEMNYWGAEPTGLGECQLPLAELLSRMAAQGTAVAKELYGTRGWVAHHNTDLWGWALPVGMGHGATSWAIWMMGGVWLARQLWDHYVYGLDESFLRDQAWPILRGAAEFGLDWLHEDADGVLRTSPSTSPENLFVGPDGHGESLSTSTPMDIALLRDLFTNCLAALDVLGLSDPLREELTSALARLPEPPVIADGRLGEWSEDLVEQEPLHRHMSHLVALYPLGQIAPGSPLASAAAKVLDARGPGAMGWSWAWKIALRARLGDGETALSLFREATMPLEGDAGRYAPVDGSRWGGLLPNLFSTHPPFQIDGNYGFVAAVVELLVRSLDDSLVLLPALPSDWPDGSVRGVRARGGLAVDLSWRDGELVAVSVRKLAGSRPVAVRVVYRDREVELVLGLGDSTDLKDRLLLP
ncbi:glycosyl hydrolase family 95 catalytic domain-containing protein [Tenggerimyces flavus]|uniref:Glycoside hydrolase N-terminal domain-containing protein n=1 Tax=Tenggerimyces flavus TaxID=1708749 RepID=A0ABV7YG06_9ACTN|nr:glycoside hydrolase N-terminal domain-containing protein [Tenggerimyces flavus]MBM7788145.1 alpha-L-fucosidase 2 [Tenggerimyces flavus]